MQESEQEIIREGYKKLMEEAGFVLYGKGAHRIIWRGDGIFTKYGSERDLDKKGYKLKTSLKRIREQIADEKIAKMLRSSEES